MQRCVCMSNSPGRTTLFERSMTVAFAGIVAFAPIDVILAFSTMMVWFEATLPDSGSTTLPALIAVICACAVRQSESKNKNDVMGNGSLIQFLQDRLLRLSYR